MNEPLTIGLLLGYSLPFLSSAIYLAAIILALNCIWRVEDKMDTFLKLLTFAIVVASLRLILELTSLSNDPNWLTIVQVFDITSGAVFLFAFSVLLRMLKSLNHEK